MDSLRARAQGFDSVLGRLAGLPFVILDHLVLFRIAADEQLLCTDVSGTNDWRLQHARLKKGMSAFSDGNLPRSLHGVSALQAVSPEVICEFHARGLSASRAERNSPAGSAFKPKLLRGFCERTADRAGYDATPLGMQLLTVFAESAPHEPRCYRTWSPKIIAFPGHVLRNRYKVPLLTTTSEYGRVSNAVKDSMRAALHRALLRAAPEDFDLVTTVEADDLGYFEVQPDDDESEGERGRPPTPREAIFSPDGAGLKRRVNIAMWIWNWRETAGRAKLPHAVFRDSEPGTSPTVFYAIWHEPPQNDSNRLGMAARVSRAVVAWEDPISIVGEAQTQVVTGVPGIDDSNAFWTLKITVEHDVGADGGEDI